MTAAPPAPPALVEGLAALLRGARPPWRSLGVEPESLLAACAEQDLAGLVQQRLARAGDCDWPGPLREALAGVARAAAAEELLRGREVTAVLDALAARGVHPVLIKGTPLAYACYEAPSLRPRRDTDLVIARADRDVLRRAMAALGYAATNYSDGEILLRQFELAREDAFGLGHAFDVHWKVSTQAAFADLLTFEELAEDAVPVPALGPHARAACPVHALLLACAHPVMHHRNVERLIWLYDIRVLAGRLSRAEFARFAAVAVRKEVAAVCAHELRLAVSRVAAEVPPEVIAALGAPGRGEECTASYLAPGRRWGQELASNLRDLPRWRERLRLLREIAFPAPGYVLRAYGMAAAGLGRALLPALYLHRGVRGVWKVVRGRK